MRSIRPQTVTLAVLAILFGLMAVWLARQVLFAKREQPQAAPPEKVLVLTLQSNLAADTRIREQDVGQVPEPPELLAKLDAKLKATNSSLEKVFRFKQQAVGRILKKAKLAGSLLTDEDFYEVGKGPQLKLKEGKRAVTLRIDDPAVSSNIIETGCLVDVIFTTDHPDELSKVTRRLASGLEVLSPPVNEGGVSNSVTSVAKKSYIVLAATPDQVNRLELAQQMDGTISVTLCAVPPTSDGSRSDPNDQKTGSRNVGATLAGTDYQVGERELLNLPPRPAPPLPPEPPERIVVEQIRGNKIDYVVFTDANIRLTQEEARENSISTEHAMTAEERLLHRDRDDPNRAARVQTRTKPKCKNCEKAREKARLKSERLKGGSTPAPGPTPAPAPEGSPDSPTPAARPGPRTT